MTPAEYQAATKAVGQAAAHLVGQQFEWDGPWWEKVGRMSAMMTRAQARAVALAEPFVADELGASGFELVPETFAGVASDGRELDTLWQGANVAANVKGAELEAKGVQGVLAEAQKAAAARDWLDMAVRTQSADAARAGLRTSLAVRDAGGVRIASRPCCPRCAQLHGKFYGWKAGFKRHPNCDCTYQPAHRPEDVQVDPIPLDQVRGLSKADRWALENGADFDQIVNAQRGMYTVEQHGQRFKATTASTVHRDAAAYRFGRGLDKAGDRLRPEAIFELAGDTPEAIDLLRRYGYIRDVPGKRSPVITRAQQAERDRLAQAAREKAAREAAEALARAERLAAEREAAEAAARAQAAREAAEATAKAEAEAAARAASAADRYAIDHMTDDEVDEFLAELADAGDWEGAERVGELLDARIAAREAAPPVVEWTPDPHDPINAETFAWYERLDDEARWAFEDALPAHMRDPFAREQWAWANEKDAAKLRGALPTERQIRAEWDNYLECEWVRLEEWCNGQTLTREAIAAGRHTRDLLTVNAKTARSWASEEVRRYWDENGRMTYEAFKASYSGAADKLGQATGGFWA